MVTLSATLVSSSLLCGISRYFWKLPLGIHIGACKPLINVIVHVTHSDPLQQSLHLSQTRLHQDQRNPKRVTSTSSHKDLAYLLWPCSTAPFEQEDSEDRALWRAFGPSKERWAQQRPYRSLLGQIFRMLRLDSGLRGNRQTLHYYLAGHWYDMTWYGRRTVTWELVYKLHVIEGYK